MAGVEMAKRHPSLWAALPHQFYYTAIFFSSEFPGAVQVYYGFSDIDLCSQAAQQFEDLVFHFRGPSYTHLLLLYQTIGTRFIERLFLLYPYFSSPSTGRVTKTLFVTPVCRFCHPLFSLI